MEITSSGETKGEKVGEKKGNVQTTRVKDYPTWRAQRVPKKEVQQMEEAIPARPKFLFPGNSKQSETASNSTARHDIR